MKSSHKKRFVMLIICILVMNSHTINYEDNRNGILYIVNYLGKYRIQTKFNQYDTNFTTER